GVSYLRLIRRFEDRDHEEVREVVINSFNETCAALFRYALWQPGIQLALLTVFCFLFLSSASFLLSSVGLALMILAVNRAAYQLITKNWIEVALKGDFLNIKKTYMETSGSCFWVAECNGKVVGTIAATPSKEKKGALELKRFAVRMGYRGRGVGKALCRALCDFAQANGNQRIMLCTSVIHYEGLKFYERFGFKKTREYCWPSLLGKALNLLMICYRYDLSLS
uniref:N-acetyltransferase domain-containing protein n=1 Tax=Erpetoichthys calabaricus TaxID=27687 RepID=A0A8C4RXH5_ERPCA